MRLNIVTHPNDILRFKTDNMSRDILLSPKTQSLIDSMIETMYGAQGVGIAAVQIGEPLRVCIVSKEASNGLTDDLVLVNPSWKPLGKKKVKDEEGCLSIPHVYGKVKRFEKIRVMSLDRAGNQQHFDCANFLARVVQHETDHLDGVLFIDKAKKIREILPE